MSSTSVPFGQSFGSLIQIDTAASDASFVKENYLLNHSGSVALKVDRGQTPDIAIVNLASVRDFSDALCR